jgi:hypothetical protein
VLVEFGDSRSRQLVQADPAFPMVSDNGLPHSGIPEFPDMIDDTHDCGGSIRLGVEKIADVIGHLYEVLDIHDLLVWKFEDLTKLRT